MPESVLIATESASGTSQGNSRNDGLTALVTAPSLVRMLALAAGFSFSAGWDWFPAMHPLWIDEFFYIDAPSDPIGQLGSLSSFVLVRTVIMLILGVVLEKLIAAFLAQQNTDLSTAQTPWHSLAGCARRVLFPGAESCPPQGVRARLYVVLPFALIQTTAFALILLLTFFLPLNMMDVIPLLIAVISALLGLLWFSLIAVLPTVWCCLTYGLAALCSLGLYLLSSVLPLESLSWLRLLCPLLGLPLLFPALPPSEALRELIARFYRHQNPAASEPGLPFLDYITGTAFPWVGLYLFTLMYGLQLLLGFASGLFITGDMQPTLGGQTGLMLASQALGAFLTAWLLIHQKGHTLFIPMLGLALFGGGALVMSLISGRAILVPSLFLHVAAGACAAFGISLLGAFFRYGSHVFRTVAWGLFLLNSFGYFGGYGLWSLAERIQKDALAYHDLYMQLLALLSLGGMLSLYALRQPLGDLFGASAEPSVVPPIEEDPEFDPSLQLTRREREVAGLVQQGMKNLEISVRLNITEATLRVHLRHVYKKLGIQGRSALRDIPLDDELPEK